jgi:hypothetical protein
VKADVLVPKNDHPVVLPMAAENTVLSTPLPKTSAA